jgi:hypothetical protein
MLVLEDCFSLLEMFDVLFIYCMFSCVIVEDVPFEVEQVQPFEEVEPQFLGEEGKWSPPPAYSFCPNNKHVFTL